MSSVDVSRTTSARHDPDDSWQLTSAYLLRAREDLGSARTTGDAEAPVVGYGQYEVPNPDFNYGVVHTQRRRFGSRRS
jgi:hypothetical protein